MKRGVIKVSKKKLNSRKGKPIKILGISTANRSRNDCAREDPISLQLLKVALKEAKRAGAQTQLIDLRELNIMPCKECYSSCPAHCRFSEELNKCDCYVYEKPVVFVKGKPVSFDKAYDMVGKKEFLKLLLDKHRVDFGDDMHVLYKAMIEADGIIFAGFTCYYSRPALMQLMISRFTALDGGVEPLWGDGKNLQNSIKYSKNPKNEYKQRLYGKFAAFINVSKEGDSASPNLMKACTMMGMRIIPFATAYRVNWYNEPTHRVDMKNSLKDSYTLSLVEHIGEQIVKEVKKSDRIYGIWSGAV